MKNMNTPFLISTITALAFFIGQNTHAHVIDFTVSSEGVKMFEVVKKDSVKSFEELKAPWKVEVKKDESRLFVFEKPGCIPVYVPIYFEPNRDIEINITMKKMDGETKTQMTVPALALADELVDKIIFTQHLVDEKKYSEALNEAEQLYLAHPQSLSVKILYANALLMNKQYQKADAIYATVLTEVPEGKDAIKKSVETLRNKIRGVRTPATSAPAAAEAKEAAETKEAAEAKGPAQE